MEIAKNIITIVYLIVCAVLIIITLLQNKDNRNSIEDVAENPNANKFYEKSKGRTKEGRIQRNTIITGIIFAVMTIILGIIYVL